MEIGIPSVTRISLSSGEIGKLKSNIRSFMSETRRIKINEARVFIDRMENPSPNGHAKVPVSQLIADGPGLFNDLTKISHIADPTIQLELLRNTVQPYLQLVSEDERDEHTGHKLNDIWRYFRFSWATPSESTPGRTMRYLIRDGARPYHPVMGIASLENAPLAITDRDTYLGWTLDYFKEEVTALGDQDLVRAAFSRLLKYIRDAIEDINIEGLCTPAECEDPTDMVLQKLANIVARSAQERVEALRDWHSGKEEDGLLVRSEMGNISKNAEDALYRRKRAGHLGRLLAARQALKHLVDSPIFPERWQGFMDSERGQTVIRSALLAQKGRHIGTSILELNVCGAIPPYNEVLGGKLVALLVLSPQIVADYKERYSQRPSDIASKIKGVPVIRPADLVYLGTTSLYFAGSSQYNRVKLPKGWLRPETPEVSWKKIGATSGYGTLHISSLTLRCLEEAADNEDGLHVNHVFGEGASPKLRTIRTALGSIFGQEQWSVSSELSRHMMRRLVYGVWLAENGREYLIGEASQPRYCFDTTLPEVITEQIVDYWRRRWLQMRLSNPEVLERISSFDKGSLLVSKDLISEGSEKFVPIGKEELDLQVHSGSPDLEAERRDFVRDFYLGTSAYADEMNPDLLDEIHVETALDQAIAVALTAGKSIVLTGNPGDGKTHIIKVLEKRLGGLPGNPLVELDASRVHDNELYTMWQSASDNQRQFCGAINQAVLFNLVNQYPEFRPFVEIKRQLESMIVYGAQTPEEYDTLVFDLSLRNGLSPGIFESIVQKLTTDYHTCNPSCGAVAYCDYIRNRSLLSSRQVVDRIQLILDRLSRRGYHATLREVQSFVSYLLFGGRSCEQLMQSSGDPDYALHQLMFSGRGELFEALRSSFDPSKVTHPIWDDRLIHGQVEPSDWLSDQLAENTSIEPNNLTLFTSRKRVFYLYHKQGDDLLKIADDDESQFFRFLQTGDRDIIRTIIRQVNLFFGDARGSDVLGIWQSHRMDQSPRRVLYSVIERHRRQFEMVRPIIGAHLAQTFDIVPDHVLLRLRTPPQAQLKVDFALFELLGACVRNPKKPRKKLPLQA
ncbi:MAG: DUF4338 domain-containing protein [Candidatus Desulforudis sp.]|nr:DUF4338 domain-containing protein [Desulforudis sp.]